MTENVSETALGIDAAWFVHGVGFDAVVRTLTVSVYNFFTGQHTSCGRLLAQ